MSSKKGQFLYLTTQKQNESPITHFTLSRFCKHWSLQWAVNAHCLQTIGNVRTRRPKTNPKKQTNCSCADHRPHFIDECNLRIEDLSKACISMHALLTRRPSSAPRNPAQVHKGDQSKCPERDLSKARISNAGVAPVQTIVRTS